MAQKTVCDICGRDASPLEFVVPYMNTYYTERDGVKLGEFDRCDTRRLNFCGACYRVVGGYLRALHDKHNKV